MRSRTIHLLNITLKLVVLEVIVTKVFQCDAELVASLNVFLFYQVTLGESEASTLAIRCGLMMITIINYYHGFWGHLGKYFTLGKSQLEEPFS